MAAEAGSDSRNSAIFRKIMKAKKFTHSPVQKIQSIKDIQTDLMEMISSSYIPRYSAKLGGFYFQVNLILMQSYYDTP